MWIRFESDYITTVLQKTDIQTEKNTETDEEIVTKTDKLTIFPRPTHPRSDKERIPDAEIERLTIVIIDWIPPSTS